MNRRIVSHALLTLSLMVVISCNNAGKEKDGSKDAPVTTDENAAPAESKPANQPKSYNAVFVPDSAILGKSSEALIKVTGASAVALTDPDGKDNGIEFVVKLQVTNRGKIGEGNSISVSYSDSRLQLDNGTSIAAETGSDYLRADPEASSKIESWTYQIPAGAKPSALNLFMNGTRVSMGVTFK
jgi:hypothetical protein